MKSTEVVADEKADLTGISVPFQLRVTKDKVAVRGQNTALMEATIYTENGSFIPQYSYLFEAVDTNGQPLAYINVNEFKQAVDDYCTKVLATEYYIKSIPRASCFSNKEMQAFNF